MDTRDGTLYPDVETARAAGVPEDSLVEVSGSKEAVQALADKLKFDKLHELERKQMRQEAQEQFRHRGLH